MAEQQPMSSRGSCPGGLEIDRREFLSQGARVAAGTAIATTALSIMIRRH